MVKQWSVALLYQYNIFLDREHLIKEMKGHIDEEDIKLKTNYKYQIVKYLGGVPIEIGHTTIFPIALDDIVKLFDAFLVIPKKETLPIYAKQNFNQLEQFCLKQGIEVPESYSCEGYICNNEMVTVLNERDNFMIQFKFKNKESTSYYLYQISFLQVGTYFFILQRETF